MRRCAFLTLEDRGDFYIYDQLLFEPLAARGWSAQELPWSRSGVAWNQYDAVVIRSTWDYQDHLAQFLQVLETIEAQTRLFNSTAICRWNSHKQYLKDLELRGVPTVPTIFAGSLEEASLERAFSALRSERLVVKPAIGANADNAFVLDALQPATWSEALAVFAQRDLLMQPFLASIQTEGEFSLFYFGGRFSHAIQKVPAAGDFRVQEEHGASITPVNAAGEALQVGEQCMAALDQSLLYARVDLVRIATGQLAVMEVELIEPSLYFEHDDGAAERFAAAFVTMAA